MSHEISYNFSMSLRLGLVQEVVLLTTVVGVWGCVTQLPALVDPVNVTGSLAVGRIVTILNGDTSRRYPPAVRFIELEEQASHKRFHVEITSHDRYFVLDLPPGQYRLTRVQITEGPFMSMADLSMAFPVDATTITYLGAWRFGVDSPRYGRLVGVTAVVDPAGAARVREFLHEQYQPFDGRAMVETLPQPAHMEARLYEVMPYPRYPRYFRRHWW